jgi:hypothetical protein
MINLSSEGHSTFRLPYLVDSWTCRAAFSHPIPCMTGWVPLFGILSILDETEIGLLIAARLGIVVFLTIATVKVIEALEPLHKLEIILILGL